MRRAGYCYYLGLFTVWMAFFMTIYAIRSDSTVRFGIHNTIFSRWCPDDTSAVENQTENRRALSQTDSKDTRTSLWARDGSSIKKSLIVSK